MLIRIGPNTLIIKVHRFHTRTLKLLDIFYWSNSAIQIAWYFIEVNSQGIDKYVSSFGKPF